jgi:hypothetical protein
MNNTAAKNYAFPPPPEREDLRYGDVHLQRGNHPFYGPDKTSMRDMKADPGKPSLESHGFYLVREEDKAKNGKTSLWRRLKSRFLGEALP